MIPVKYKKIRLKTVGAVTLRRKVYELTKQTNKQTSIQHIVVGQTTSCLKQAVAKKRLNVADHCAR